jgi:hypothetical protein
MVLAGTIVGVPAGGVPPAAAQTVPQWTVVGGNFTGDARDESFWYLPGGHRDDVLVSSSNGGVPGGPIEETERTFNVTKTYRPFAGDFDGDGYDELFWYAPGAAADSIWHWPADDPAHPVSRPISVRGTYTPVVGDFNGDEVDDILWYAPGPAADSLWYFRRDGSRASVTLDIRTTYRPVVASIGKDSTDDIIWYAPGTAPDTGWDFTYGTRSFTSMHVTVNGSSYRPIGLDIFGEGPRSEDVWWYAPGSGADPVWDYVQGARVPDHLVPLGSNWRVAVGDYFGDGQEDVYLTDINLGYTLRDFTTIDGVAAYVDYHVRFPSLAASSAEQRPEGVERSEGMERPTGIEVSEPVFIG